MENSLPNEAAIAEQFINQTSKNIFLTGKAGTGKTTFLKYILSATYKRTVVAAPTGIAAINAGGVTLHSLFQLPFGSFIPANITNKDSRFHTPVSLVRNQHMNENKRRLLREMELLIIDEVSMLRADLLDAIDTVLRFVRRNQNPFGGIQILFIGDLLQLPPVVKDEEWVVLKNYYKSQHFFAAKALSNNSPIYVELDKIFRQSDNQFISLLNNLRNNKVTHKDIELLNAYYKPLVDLKSENCITLTTHNYKADSINREMLAEIDGESFSYGAIVNGDFNEFVFPVEKTIILKVGAQVMFIKNDNSGNQRYFNGKIGIVSNLNKNSIEVKFPNENNLVYAEMEEWENNRFVADTETGDIKSETIGTFKQYPIKLAWAITVHKSQGLTFNKAIIDTGEAFAPGQVYVALSRLRSLDGLILISKINTRSLLNDENIIEFGTIKSTQGNTAQLIESSSRQYYCEYAQNVYNLTELSYQLKNLMNSKNETERKSTARKRCLPKLNDFIERVKALSDFSVKFNYEIERIKISEEYDKILYARLNSAYDYFSSKLNQISNEIIELILTIKSEKKIKTIVKELLVIEQIIFDRVCAMKRVSLLAKGHFEKKHYSLNELNRILKNEARKSTLENLFIALKNPTKKLNTQLKGEKKEKVKGETKKISFELFKTGMTIEQIAGERKLTATTVENHLAHFVALGELDVEQFIEVEKFEKACAVIKKEQMFNLNQLRDKLGAEYSYSELRMSLAGYFHQFPDAATAVRKE